MSGQVIRLKEQKREKTGKNGHFFQSKTWKHL